jgi:hypothetical protein
MRTNTTMVSHLYIYIYIYKYINIHDIYEPGHSKLSHSNRRVKCGWLQVSCTRAQPAQPASPLHLKLKLLAQMWKQPWTQRDRKCYVYVYIYIYIHVYKIRTDYGSRQKYLGRLSNGNLKTRNICIYIYMQLESPSEMWLVANSCALAQPAQPASPFHLKLKLLAQMWTQPWAQRDRK